MLSKRGPVAAGVITALALVSACGGKTTPSTDTPPSTTTTTTVSASTSLESGIDSDTVPADTSVWPIDPAEFRGDAPQRWTVEVVRLVPHDADAFTQGLELVDGAMYESTGLYGESTLRRIDATSGEVHRSVDLDPELFGEGITQVGDTLIQLTWREEVALRWQLPGLEPLEQFAYAGEGWGICLLDDETIVTTDGSHRLTHRNPADFAIKMSVDVMISGDRVTSLNELECVDGYVLANIFGLDTLVAIDPHTGSVVATIDATPAAVAVERPVESGAVLNGIADLGDGSLLLGGKWWPEHVVVKLVAG